MGETPITEDDAAEWLDRTKESTAAGDVDERELKTASKPKPNAPLAICGAFTRTSPARILHAAMQRCLKYMKILCARYGEFTFVTFLATLFWHIYF